MQLAGIENTVKSRVKRVMIYDEAPFPGLSPTETNDVFTVIFYFSCCFNGKIIWITATNS